jgi:hypothetical protein
MRDLLTPAVTALKDREASGFLEFSTLDNLFAKILNSALFVDSEASHRVVHEKDPNNKLFRLSR